MRRVHSTSNVEIAQLVNNLRTKKNTHPQCNEPPTRETQIAHLQNALKEHLYRSTPNEQSVPRKYSSKRTNKTSSSANVAHTSSHDARNSDELADLIFSMGPKPNIRRLRRRSDILKSIHQPPPTEVLTITRTTVNALTVNIDQDVCMSSGYGNTSDSCVSSGYEINCDPTSSPPMLPNFHSNNSVCSRGDFYDRDLSAIIDIDNGGDSQSNTTGISLEVDPNSVQDNYQNNGVLYIYTHDMCITLLYIFVLFILCVFFWQNRKKNKENST